MITIRQATVADISGLVNIWRRSVTATHTFLTPNDIDSLVPEAYQGLSVMEVWVAEVDGGPAGFMALQGNMIEALFIDPTYMGRKLGTRLIEHARELRGAKTELRLDVNEQNSNALGFYLAKGFKQIGRSETDNGGRPWPQLHLILPPA